jgi:transcriptional regulator with GAF, ATPase, and Fis domain
VPLDDSAQLAPEQLVRFERLLSNTAAQLLNVAPDEMDGTIQASISELGAYLGAERGGIALFSEDGRSLTFKYGYFAAGVNADLYVTDLAQALPWYAGELRAGRAVIVPRVPHGFPPEAVAELEFAAAIGLKSNVTLPLKAGGEVLGVLGWDHLSAYRSWSPEFLSRLELLASVYATALYRRRAQARLQESHDLNRSVLASVPDVTELAEAKLALEKSLAEVRELKDRLEAENVFLHEEVRQLYGFDEIVGKSKALARVLDQVERVASTDSSVLFLGETGTGKDLVARALHDRSARRGRPLVAINCAAVPAALVESELFGYEKGAFTGAVQKTLGRFEVAHGGSIFLDEVGELPLDVQAKLLRVLQSGEFERLGSSKTVKVDVRLIAATNRDLEREVKEGRFRADLFYRLSVFPITLPPLREHPEDIPLLVWHFIARRQANLGRSVTKVPERLMRAFVGYAWPGNVRELQNVVERALIMSNGATLAADAVFLDAAPVPPAIGPKASLADMERAHIRVALDECGWKVGGKGNAADRLGLRRSTLQYRMKKLGIARPGIAE